MKRPPGALSDEERKKLNKEFPSRSDGSKGGIYLVRNYDGKILTGTPRPADGLYFEWTPSMGHYFKNYWFAYAYSLKIKAKNENAKT
jgi:hypothetical protein